MPGRDLTSWDTRRPLAPQKWVHDFKDWTLQQQVIELVLIRWTFSSPETIALHTFFEPQLLKSSNLQAQAYYAERLSFFEHRL